MRAQQQNLRTCSNSSKMSQPKTETKVMTISPSNLGEQTGHPGSRATSYITHGDLVSSLDLPGAETVEHWYFIAGMRRKQARL